jgi:nitrite reductase/ring-hydroxylating ferredoxin subunit
MAHAPFPGDAPPEFERVCAVREVAPGTMRAVTLSDGTRACVGNRSGSFFAVSDRCPHQKYPLSDGQLTREGTIVCSWHGATYDCTSGRAVRGPIRGIGEREEPLGRLHIYDVRLTDGDVFVRLPEETL